MMDPGETMNREEIAAFLASLKKLRDGLDDFNCQLAAIDGAGMRLSMLCQETAAACLAASTFFTHFSDLLDAAAAFAKTRRRKASEAGIGAAHDSEPTGRPAT